MFQRLFGRERNTNRAIVDALYEAIVAAARREPFYSQWQVPDTPLGRFEMLSLHMFLVQHRLKDERGSPREIAQILIDEFFQDVDHSLRELGIGDLGIPKRMKKLARMHYGRTTAYGYALVDGDRKALAEALARNIRPDTGVWSEADELAGYVMRASKALAGQQTGTICRGSIGFPLPGAVERT